MRLTVLGCSGSYPGPESPASSYLVEADGPDGAGGTRVWRILLDLGNGALGALQRHLAPGRLDAVFLTHLHPDHCLDLCGLYVLRRYHPQPATGRLGVWGPAGVAERMARAYDLHVDPGMSDVFDFGEYAGPVDLGPFRVTPHPVAHPVPAFALRVHAGDRVLAYSGDTGPCAGLDEAAAGAHLLLCEASFLAGGDHPPDLHLTGTEAGEVAARGDVGRLVVTHVPPWQDPEAVVAEAAAAYQGPVSGARADLVLGV